MAKRDSFFIDPSLIEPHFSTRIYKGYLIYLKKLYPEPQVREFVLRTGIPLEYLENEQNWVSEKYADLFFEVMAKLPELPEDYSRQAAHASLTKEALGSIITLLIRFQNPTTVFKQFLQYSKRYNRVDDLQIKNIGSNSLELHLNFHRKSQFEKEIIDNWVGFLEEIPKLFGGPQAKIRILNKSQQNVVFGVEWQVFSKSLGLQLLMGAIAAASVFYQIFATWKAWQSSALDTNLIANILTSTIVLTFSSIILFKNYRGRKEQELHYKNIIEESENRYIELLDSKKKLDRRYQEANLLRQVLTRITSSPTEEGQIETTVAEIKERLQYDRVIYMRHFEETNEIKIYKTRGFAQETQDLLSRYSIPLAQVTPSSLHLGNVFKTGKSLLIPVAEDYVNSLSPEGRALITSTKSQSFIAVPVQTEKQKFGVLLVDYCRDHKRLTRDDLHIIENVAVQLAISLQNVRNYEKERDLRLTFQRFVPEPILKKILAHEDSTLKKGLRKEVTVLFSDLRDFTKNSTKISPERLVELLNIYFNEMTPIVYSEGGIVDKFLGDGLFAIFNAFENTEDHAERAVRAALRMQQKITEINDSLNWTEGDEDYIKFEAGIGIHTGIVTLCTIGNEEKTEFTAIGETVNIAARLEGKSKEFSRTAVVISSKVAHAIQHSRQSYGIRSAGFHAIRGLGQEIELFLVNPSQLVQLAVPQKAPKTRFQEREKVAPQDHLKAVFVNGMEIVDCDVYDYTAFGCALKPKNSAILNSNLKITNFKLYSNTLQVGAYEEVIVCGVRENLISVQFKTEGDPQIKRVYPRLGILSGFEPEASFQHPFRFDSQVILKCVDLNASGAGFVTSARNRALFRDMQIEKLCIQLPSIGQFTAPFQIKSIVALPDDKIRVGGCFLKADSADLHEKLGSFLLLFAQCKTDSRIDAIRAAGLFPTEIKKFVDFELVQSDVQYAKAIKVRELAYQTAGKFEKNSSTDSMRDRFDQHSKIFVASIQGEAIGSVRVTHSSGPKETFELEESLSLPEFISAKRTQTIEVSRLSVDPRYQRTDLVLGLVERAIEFAVKSNVLHVITSCTEEKIKIYDRLGFQVDPNPFELKTLAGIPHYLLTLNVQATLPTGGRNPIAWHFTYGPVVRFLKRMGYYKDAKESFWVRLSEKTLVPLIRSMQFQRRRKRAATGQVLKMPAKKNSKKDSGPSKAA